MFTNLCFSFSWYYWYGWWSRIWLEGNEGEWRLKRTSKEPLDEKNCRWINKLRTSCATLWDQSSKWRMEEEEKWRFGCMYAKKGHIPIYKRYRSQVIWTRFENAGTQGDKEDDWATPTNTGPRSSFRKRWRDDVIDDLRRIERGPRDRKLKSFANGVNWFSRPSPM